MERVVSKAKQEIINELSGHILDSAIDLALLDPSQSLGQIQHRNREYWFPTRLARFPELSDSLRDLNQKHHWSASRLVIDYTAGHYVQKGILKKESRRKEEIYLGIEIPTGKTPGLFAIRFYDNTLDQELQYYPKRKFRIKRTGERQITPKDLQSFKMIIGSIHRCFFTDLFKTPASF